MGLRHIFGSLNASLGLGGNVGSSLDAPTSPSALCGGWSGQSYHNSSGSLVGPNSLGGPTSFGSTIW